MSKVPYPFFVLPEPMATEVAEARTSDVSTVFICRGTGRAQAVRQLLAEAGIRFRERQLGFGRHEFICEPSTGAQDVARLALVGDLRNGNGRSRQYSIAAQLWFAYTERPFRDGVILLGDNLYSGRQDQWRQGSGPAQKFERPFAEIIEHGVPFYAVLGEEDYANHSSDFQRGYPLFNMVGRRYYSQRFRQGLVQLFILDSTTLLSPDGEEADQQQIDWLRNVLAGSRATWKIVAMHEPIYSTARGRASDPGLARLLGPILSGNGVALVMQGHEKVYERLAPIDGVVYITSGNAIEVERGALEQESDMRLGGNDQSTGLATVEFTPDKCRIVAYDALGKTVDEALIQRPGLAADTNAISNGAD